MFIDTTLPFGFLSCETTVVRAQWCINRLFVHVLRDAVSILVDTAHRIFRCVFFQIVHIKFLTLWQLAFTLYNLKKTHRKIRCRSGHNSRISGVNSINVKILFVASSLLSLRKHIMTNKICKGADILKRWMKIISLVLI